VSKRRLDVAETVADYDVRSPAARTIATVVGTVLVVAVLAVLVLGLSILKRDSRVATSQVDVGTNANLIIDATTAQIEIVEGEPDLLTITSTVTSGLRQTDYQVGRKGDEIKIVSRCQTWLNPGCGVKTQLAVPPGLPLRVKTTTGDIEVKAMSQGLLTVETTTGNVTARDLQVDEFEATSISGQIVANFSEQPLGFKATTDSGDVTASFAAGDRTYALSVESESGDIQSELSNDAEGDGFIRVRTGSGDVRLTVLS